MAFEDFIKYTPVITETDYETIRIHEGENAHTDNFNRSVVDSINRDTALESALTYLARSSSLFVTANTRFISHCEGQGVDLIKSVPPVLTTAPEDMFLADTTFIGAAWPQRAATNMMMYGEVNSKLTSRLGWTVSNPEEIGATIISSRDEYTVVSTLHNTNDIVPGEVTFTSAIIPITVDGSNTLNKISAGVTMITNNNMQTTNTEFLFSLRMLDSKGNVVDTNGQTVKTAQYNGVVGVENIDIPDTATHFQVFMQINFDAKDSYAEFTLKNVMVQAGGILAPYTETTRQQCTCEYKRVIDPSQGNITAMCWSIFKPYSLATHAGPIGPLFLRMNNMTIGGVHRAKDVDKLVLALYINDNGYTQYGNEITIPDEYSGSYLLSAIRIRPTEEDASKSFVELSVVAGETVYKSQLVIDTVKVTSGDIILGTDHITADFFNGPVSEVRYDTEWINDMELYIIALARKAFSYKRSNDLGPADDGESIMATLDKVGVNLILNPSAKLAFVGWYGYPEGNFTISHNDTYAGNCFVWVGNSNAKHVISSEPMPIKPNNLYTMRAIMFSEESSVGDAGIGIAWYDVNDEKISESSVNIAHVYMPKYYEVAAVAPTDAINARVFMYVNNDLKSTRLTWSRLKFEMGDATQFTDDSGAGYALYYL